MEQQRARDVVRQIANHADRRALARRIGQRREVKCQCVTGVQYETAAETLLQPCDQISIELNCVQRIHALEQRHGQRAQARPDLHEPIRALRPDCVDDCVDYTGVDEEVLAEALAREVALMLTVDHEAARFAIGCAATCGTTPGAPTRSESDDGSALAACRHTPMAGDRHRGIDRRDKATAVGSASAR
ncbi:hypothetical protein DFQ30_000892 [Apophysomyces sp. BC1015]|nr:hypothetical protein DFQ30_000892 [Apophysomyces sp. BC1015]